VVTRLLERSALARTTHLRGCLWGFPLSPRATPSAGRDPVGSPSNPQLPKRKPTITQCPAPPYSNIFHHVRQVVTSPFNGPRLNHSNDSRSCEPYAVDIRTGRHRPHPRHWRKLAEARSPGTSTTWTSVVQWEIFPPRLRQTVSRPLRLPMTARTPCRVALNF
jgi:hypothetical protein